MRNISFMLTESQFLDGTKDVTRRLGWEFLKAGDRLMGCRKCQGIKPGEKIVKLGVIEVVSVRREPLNRMARVCEIPNGEIGYGATEAIREGFPHLTGDRFVTMFCKHMKCRPDQIVTRIEFKSSLFQNATFSPDNSDMGFLMWIHERLEHIHGESPLMDYMHKLRAIIAEMNPAQCTPSHGQGKNGMRQLQKAILG